MLGMLNKFEQTHILHCIFDLFNHLPQDQIKPHNKPFLSIPLSNDRPPVLFIMIDGLLFWGNFISHLPWRL